MARLPWHLCRILSCLVVLGFAFSGTIVSAQSTELEKLKQGLQSPKEQDRIEAIRKWKSTDAEAGKAAEVLVGALGDNSYQVQQAARQVLHHMGEKAALPLVQGLQSKNNTRLRYAAQLLQELGPKAQAVIPAMVKVLVRGDDQPRNEAEQLLQRLGKTAAPALAEALKSASSDERNRVEQVLVQIRAEAALPALLAMCKSGDDSAYWPAVAHALERLQLGNVEKLPPDLVPTLARHFKDKDLKNRSAAVQVVKSFSWKAQPVAPALVSLLADPDPTLRSQVTDLVKNNLGVEAVLPSLIAELRNPSAEVREAVLTVGIEHFKWRTEKIWPALIPLLKDKEARIRRASAAMFYDMQVPQAMCHLGAALSDENVEVRRAAANTIEHLHWVPVQAESLGKGDQRKAIIAAIVRGLRDPEEPIRKQAEEILKKIGPETVPEILAGLKKEDVEGRIHAAMVIASFAKTAEKPIPKEALPLFLDGAHSDHGDLQAISLTALSKSLPESLPAFKELLADKNVGIRRATVESLLQEKGAGKKALDILLGALEDSDEDVRHSASRAIGKIGKPAAPPVIKLALESKKLEVRLAALKTLGSMREPSPEMLAAVDKLFLDPAPEIRAAAVKARDGFAVADPKNRATIQQLLPALSDNDWHIRRSASVALARMRREAVPGLIAILEKGPEGPGRAEAVKTLAAIGLPASPAIKTLLSVIRSRDPNNVPLRTDAVIALTRIDIEESHDAIVTLLNDEDSGVQTVAAGALDAGSAGLAREVLLKLLSSPHVQVRSASARALAKVGPGILPEVEPLLAHKEGDIRAAALQAVANFESAANLGKLLLDDNLAVRELAASTLVKNGTEAEPIMIDALRSNDFRAQTAVADAIASFEDRRDDFVPVLVEILLAKDAQELELRSAAKAIRRVNPILGARILADKAQTPGLIALLKKQFSDVDELACLALSELAVSRNASDLLAELLKRPETEANVLAAAIKALAAVGPAEGKEKLDSDLLARIVKGTHASSAGLREEMRISLQTQSSGLGSDAVAQVLSALALGQVAEEVDQWIIRQAQGLDDSRNASDAGSPSFVRLLALFHSGNQRFKGRLSPAAEQALKEHFWRFLQKHSEEILPPPEADVKTALLKFDLPWKTSAYLALDVLKDDAQFKDRQIKERTVAQLYQGWNVWWRAWAKERALSGLASEMGLDADQVIDWPCLLNLYDCASDAVVKQRVKMLLDLSAIEEEQVSLYGTRGGRRLPVRETASGCGLDSWKDVLQGENPRRLGESGALDSGIVWTTSYQLPPTAILLRKLYRPVPYYSVTDRDFAGGSVLAFVTPHYILGSQFIKAGEPNEAPGTWHRLIFDDMNAVFFPLLTGERLHVQHQNVYISCWTGKEKARQTLEFTSELKVVENSGWLFLCNGPAFAGIQIKGGYKLGTADHKIPGRKELSTITFKDPKAFVVLQAGDVHKFDSFEKFQDAVVKAPLQFTESSVKYTGPQAPAIEFFRDPSRPPAIAGMKDQRGTVYDSPYLLGRTGNPRVTVRFGPYAATYDFVTNVVKEGNRE